MTEKPIIMSAPMVKAILREIQKPGTGKTQTRRIIPVKRIKPSIWTHRTISAARLTDDGWRFRAGNFHVWSSPLSLRWQAGDSLWVREAFMGRIFHDEDPSDARKRRYAFYRASTPGAAEDDGHYHNYPMKWTPSIHMPRWAARIMLDVTEVRIERLQDISVDDAIAEGCYMIEDGAGAGFWIVDGGPMECCAEGVVECYERLWEHINGESSWDTNPWVAAITFKPRFIHGSE